MLHLLYTSPYLRRLIFLLAPHLVCIGCSPHWAVKGLDSIVHLTCMGGRIGIKKPPGKWPGGSNGKTGIWKFKTTSIVSAISGHFLCCIEDVRKCNSWYYIWAVTFSCCVADVFSGSGSDYTWIGKRRVPIVPNVRNDVKTRRWRIVYTDAVKRLRIKYIVSQVVFISICTDGCIGGCDCACTCFSTC